MNQLVCRPTGAVADVASRPLISALVSTCNEEAYLRECLLGLLEQTVAGRLEIVVIDHGSQQAEWAIVTDLQRQHRNIVALRVAAGTSACSAWNMGARMASGRYLVALQAPDSLRRDALEQLCAALEADPGAALAYGDTCFTAIPHETFESHTSYGKMIWPDYTPQQLTLPSVVAPHLVWRRELHDSIGWFDESCDRNGLHGFLLRTVERHRTLHLDAFTGLKLVPREKNPVVRDATDAPAATSLRQESAAPAAPVAPLMAEDAYQEIRLLLGSGKDEAASRALKAHLEIYSGHAVAHNDLAAVSYRLGEMESALHHYQEGVRLEPNDTVFRKNLADFYFVEAGRTDEAIGIYLNLLQESPHDPETLLNIGIICEHVGQPGEAESFYQRALEIEPWNLTVRERLSALRAAAPAPAPAAATAEERYAAVQEVIANGAVEEAIAQLEAIIADFPDCAVAHNDLAVLSYQAGDQQKALLHYEKAASLAPENGIFQKNLADFYVVHGNNLDAAIAIYLEELRKKPSDVETLMCLGRICNVVQRPEEARTFLNRALEIEPWNLDARDALQLVA